MNLSQKVVITDENNLILAIRRSHTDPSRPLTWDFPGGEVEEGEDLTENILREIKEEVGIEIKNLKIVNAVGSYNKKGEYWVCIGYKAEAVTKDVVLSFEHDQFEWVTKEEFLSRESTDKLRRLANEV